MRLRDHGAELIEVSDNGTGIEEANWEAVALKYHTSKLASFDDLQVRAAARRYARYNTHNAVRQHLWLPW